MNIDALLSPRSIAVIGASTKPGSVGHSLTENLLTNGYRGNVYPVNPKTNTLFDKPCYPNLEALPEVPDLAVIIIPASGVPAILENAGARGVKAAIIISSGFKESGATGAELEEAVSQVAKKYDIALLGPIAWVFSIPIRDSMHPSLLFSPKRDQLLSFLKVAPSAPPFLISQKIL